MSRTEHRRKLVFKLNITNYKAYYNYYKREKKIWRRLMKHKKQRIRERLALNKVMRGNYDVNFPHDKKPRNWYW